MKKFFKKRFIRTLKSRLFVKRYYAFDLRHEDVEKEVIEEEYKDNAEIYLHDLKNYIQERVIRDIHDNLDEKFYSFEKSLKNYIFNCAFVLFLILLILM